MGRIIKLAQLKESHLILWELIIISPLYFFFSLINLSVKLRITSAWGNGTLVRSHGLFIQFIGTNNEQSRILQFMIPEALHRILGISIEHGYMLQRLGFVFLTFCCFHFYLRAWFGLSGAFSGVIFLSAIMPLTYMNHLQESSPLLMLTFLLSLWAIRERKTFLLILAFIVGAFNNETILILPLAYFLYNYESTDLKAFRKLIWRTFLISLPLIIIIGSIRYLTRNNPPLAPLWQLPNNIFAFQAGFKSGLLSASNFIFYIFNLVWIYAFLEINNKPLFMRRLSVLIPVFLFIHLLIARLEETRLMLPLSFLVIPMGLWFIFYSRSDVSSPFKKTSLEG